MGSTLSSPIPSSPLDFVDRSWKQSDVVKEDIALPNGSKKLAFVLHGIMTAKECDKLISQTEAVGYIPALLNTGKQEVYAPDVRNSARVMLDDATASDILFRRIRPFLPDTWHAEGGVWRLEGANERLRFLRYYPGERFLPHFDGSYQRPDSHAKGGDKSFVTLQFYLNEGYTGGATTLLSDTVGVPDVHIAGSPGKVLVFQHDILHAGSVVESGKKYALRTDVMFTRR